MTISPVGLAQETLKQISRAGFSLPPATVQAVRRYLQCVSRVDASRLQGMKNLEYRNALAQATKELLNDPHPNDPVKIGYYLAFKVLSSIHQEKEGDKSEQRHHEKIVKAIKQRVKDRQVQKTVDVFCAYYLQINTLQKFARDGRSIGRAQIAYLLAHDELVTKGEVSANDKFRRAELLLRLKAIAREEGYKLFKEQEVAY